MDLQGLHAKDASVERQGERRLDTNQDTGEGNRKRRIRCPRCRWQPRPEHRWLCRCGHVWNTFDTAGLCPGCGFQWHVTACLSCFQFSPHQDWYAEEPESSEA